MSADMTTGTTVLLIEDDRDDYVLTAELLAEIGESNYALSWVDNYEAGVQALLSDPPDLCLLDFRLGSKTGLDLLREVTALGCTVPIVFLTGQAEHDLDVEVMKAGAADYLIKGQFGANPLERSIRYAIERRRSAALRDLRERKQAEAERARAAERLTSAVESIQQAFALFDADDRLIQCNSAYRRLMGPTLQGPLIGRSYAEVVTGWSRSLAFADEQERARCCVEWIVRRRGDQGPFEVRTSDGRSLRVMDRPTPEGGLVEMIWDITEDVRREDDLRGARRAADEGNAAKTDFLASVSHELRTPLNAILGFSQLLQRDRKPPLDPRHAVWAGHIYTSGEHLLRLIDDILDLSHIESRSVAVSLGPVSVCEVLRAVRATIEPMAARMQVEVSAAPVPWASTTVEADRTRFTQVLVNFASNAVKYNTPGGRLEFAVTSPAPERVRITVSDTGVGVPLNKQAALFQPFQRAGQESGPIEGTGIGLALSKRLAELMHGAVGFRSAPGEGSAFWIELPAHAAGPVAIDGELAQASAALPAAAAARPRVLYIEDNLANVALMEEIMGTIDGVELMVARTAETGLALARERRPDAILMDIDLPDMSGFEALAILRGLPETAEVPVIALTAAAAGRDRERGLRAGFLRYLTKPIRIEELEAALAAARILG